MEVGALVLRSDPDDGWIIGRISAISGRGEKARVIIGDQKCSVDEVHVVQQASLDTVEDDLMNLSDFHEAMAFQQLKNVYLSGRCTVGLGKDISIVLNPFSKELPQGPLYDEAALAAIELNEAGFDAYVDSLHPSHPWVLANKAYTHVKKGLSSSVLVTGESGAGKTETTKALLSFLTRRSYSPGKVTQQRDMVWLKDQVMQANAILEVFGNAKTKRNDNSSRFGKHICLQFETGSGRLLGAEIRSYLLEASRVVTHASSERNFHSFYALLQAPLAIRNELLGAGVRAQDFKCLNPGTSNYCRGVDDSESFKLITRSLSGHGLTERQQVECVWRIVAAIMHLLNITFEPAGSDGCHVVDDQWVVSASHLLGVQSSMLINILSTSKLRGKGSHEVIQTRMTLVKAQAVRDGIAKCLYQELFNWLLSLTNRSLCRADHSQPGASISLLDLFGFEDFFPENHFEQLLINYANESLQNYYNRCLFTSLKDTCTRENVSFEVPRYEDSKGCLEVIHKVLSLLDDECALSGLKSSDLNYYDRLKSQFTGPLGQRLSPYFSLPKGLESRGKKKPLEVAFVISHYAGDITYLVKGFIAKNKKLTNLDILREIAASSSALDISNLLKRALAVAPERSGTEGLVSRRFKGQITELLDSISRTETFWIRCIKPNASKLSNLFEGGLVYHQLQSNGIVPTIKLLRTGPQQISFSAFITRFQCLATGSHMQHKPRDICASIARKNNLPPHQMQVGTHSCVLVTTEGLQKLGKLVVNIQHVCAKRLSAAVRGFLGRRLAFFALVSREKEVILEGQMHKREEREKELRLRDSKRKKAESEGACQRREIQAAVVSRIQLMTSLESDRQEYRTQAHRQLDAWSSRVVSDTRDWKKQEHEWQREYATKRATELAQFARQCKKHEKTMQDIERRAEEEDQWVRRRMGKKLKEEQEEREMIETKKMRREQQAYLDEFHYLEHQAKTELCRKVRRNRQMLENERRLKILREREKVTRQIAKSRQLTSALEAECLIQEMEKQSARLQRTSAALFFETQQTLWQQAEIEQGADLLRYLAEQDPARLNCISSGVNY